MCEIFEGLLWISVDMYCCCDYIDVLSLSGEVYWDVFVMFDFYVGFDFMLFVVDIDCMFLNFVENVLIYGELFVEIIM